MRRIRIFTDGACSENPGIGGWAAIICLKHKSVVISGGENETTNNRMELMAVIKAIEKIKEKKKKQRKIVLEIHSDSAYVVNAVEHNWLKRWKENNWKTKTNKDIKNRDLWEKLINLIEQNDLIKVEFVKVKGHSGNMFNEMADRVAVGEVTKLKIK